MVGACGGKYMSMTDYHINVHIYICENINIITNVVGFRVRVNICDNNDW